MLRAWEQKYQVEAVAREEELFPNMRRERRGMDDEAQPDEEEATDVGAPIDEPADLEVRGGASGLVLLRRNTEADHADDEAQQAETVGEWAEALWGALGEGQGEGEGEDAAE